MFARKITLSVVLVLSCVLPALAGGDEGDVIDDSAIVGPAYLGFVRDTRGVPIANAEVTLRPKQGDPVVLQTNMVGYYRSHISKDVQPDDVEVICKKDGFQQVDGVRRPHPNVTRFVEINCAMPRQ